MQVAYWASKIILLKLFIKIVQVKAFRVAANLSAYWILDHDLAFQIFFIGRKNNLAALIPEVVNVMLAFVLRRLIAIIN